MRRSGRHSSRQRATGVTTGRSNRVRTVAIVAAAALLVAGAAYAFNLARPAARAAAPVDVKVARSAPATDSIETSDSVGMVEVPVLVGSQVSEARIVLQSAGFVVAERESAESTVAPAGRVLSQEPIAGTVATAGSTVVLVVAKASVQPAPASSAAPAKPITLGVASSPKSTAGSDVVVCIDAGHQARGDSSPEPIGPGATATKPSVAGGATGVVTDIPEYEIALQIAMNLRRRLESAGVKVVMVRTTNDVNISNSERAAIANKAHADLFVRIHGDGSPDRTISGISTLYPASNQWTKSIAAPSKRAAEKVQAAVVASTGAVDRRAVARTDLSGFNWCTVPAVLVECGFLSNSVEDKLLSSPHYQDKLAEGIAAGVLAYTEVTR